MRPADKLQMKAATILSLVGLARSKQDPINCGHGRSIYSAPARDKLLKHADGELKRTSSRDWRSHSSRTCAMVHLINAIVHLSSMLSLCLSPDSQDRPCTAIGVHEMSSSSSTG